MWVSVALIPTQRSDAYDYDFWVNEKRLTKLNGDVEKTSAPRFLQLVSLPYLLIVVASTEVPANV